MTVNRKPTGTASAGPAGLAAGVISAVAMTLLGALITAKLIDAQIIGWNASGYCVLLILVLSSWMGAVVSAGKIKRQRIAVCAATGVLYFGALLLTTALFFGGQYSGVGETGLLVICGSILGIFTGVSGKTGRKRPKFRIQNR